ncbi:MAG: DUF3800 domain-containing protein [Chloroflexota bacterium]
MYVYLDESGDTGFKFRQGSTRYFVVALLLVDDPIPLHQAVHDLRLALSKGEDHEFKFVHTHHAGRVEFLRALLPYRFSVRAIVVDKHRIESPNPRKKEKFYNYVVKLPLEYDFDAITNAKLVIDESFKGKGRQADLTTYLRRQLNSVDPEGTKKIADVLYHESHRDNLLQVVDMIAGAVARVIATLK